MLACSALKAEYRRVLAWGDSRAAGTNRCGVAFVLLQPPEQELLRRVALRYEAHQADARSGAVQEEGAHDAVTWAVPPSLLDSQLRTLSYAPAELAARVTAERGVEWRPVEELRVGEGGAYPSVEVVAEELAHGLSQL